MADYRLVRNGLLLGTLTQTQTDWPWCYGEFEPVPDFETVRALFDRERELLDADEADAWNDVWNELSNGLQL